MTLAPMTATQVVTATSIRHQQLLQAPTMAQS
jgi:hypothetical protein